MTGPSRYVFDHLSVTLRPRKRLAESATKRLQQHLNNLDLWSFEKGMTLDHVTSPRHLAFRTSDGVLIGLYNSGRVDIEIENADASKAPRIGKLVSRLLQSIKRATRLNTAYQASLILHSNVKSRRLLRFMHASTISALNPYLRLKLGREVEVRGLLVRLSRNLSMGMILPDDLDFMGGYKISKRHKDLLRSFMNEASSTTKALGA